MSELKAYNVVATADVNPDVVDNLGCTECPAYDKEEADKVIAELKDDVTYWKKVAKKNMDDNVAMARERAKAFESEHRRKHKRCLAMARWCETELEKLDYKEAIDYTNKDVWRIATSYFTIWHKRWLELAEKFKPNNKE